MKHKMKTLFTSQDLWEFAKKGYNEASALVETLKDLKKKDVKVLFFIKKAIDENIFA